MKFLLPFAAQRTGTANFSLGAVLETPKRRLLLRSLIHASMAVTRLKRKGRKDKSKSKVRQLTLKNENFKPVLKSVDVEKIKEEFKAKAAAKA